MILVFAFDALHADITKQYQFSTDMLHIIRVMNYSIIDVLKSKFSTVVTQFAYSKLYYYMIARVILELELCE